MRGGATLDTKGFDRVLRQRIKGLAGIKLTVGIHRGKPITALMWRFMEHGITLVLKTRWAGN